MNLLLLRDEDFVGSSRARISGRRAEHLHKVLKVQMGDSLRAGLWNGLMGQAQVVGLGESIDVDTDFHQAPPPPLPLTLILALPRPKALGRIIQSITALGVKRLALINSQRVEKSFWQAEHLSEAGLLRHITLGLEQACDTQAPKITLHRRFKPFMEDELAELASAHRGWVAHPLAERSLPRKMAEHPLALAVGPDGGWIPFELSLWEKAGFQLGQLGERILRVETAVTALVGRFLS